MDEVFSKILKVLTPENKNAVDIFIARVTGEEPLKLEVGGVPLPFFTKNTELNFNLGDKCLCLYDDNNIYVICKVG